MEIRIPSNTDSEKTIESYLVSEFKKRIGGQAYKFTSPARRSVPDRLMLSLGMPAEFVELKSEKGKLTPGQKREITLLRALGYKVYVLYSKEHVRNYIEDYKFRKALSELI